MTVKYGNVPKSEIRKKKKMNCKEQNHEGREGIFKKKKKKVSRQRKPKSLLKAEIRHLLFWQLLTARKTLPAKPNF